jgi:transcriptional regulator with XRE-family HTH domain
MFLTGISGNISLTFGRIQTKSSRSRTWVTWKAMKHVQPVENSIDQRALFTASAFGSLIRGRRKALKLRQDQLALATGVGRRFLIELEAGKPSCQLGRSLLVAEALGLTFADILACRDPSAAAPEADAPELPDELPEGTLPELPDELPEDLTENLADSMEEPDGRPAGIF